MKSKTNQISTIHRSVYTWYTQHGRHHLPWRTTNDPYHIYLSEVMLQQTQVQQVENTYYPQFLTAFPTLQSLANASLDQVLQIWQGLGYYRRAKFLHATAQQYAPNLPTTIPELMQCKGIGRNTAHAIMAFAHKQPVAILEANVKRIMFRMHALTHATDNQLWELADQLLDRDHPFEWNQALMDIGATICTPQNPKCSNCPLNALCEGKTLPHNYPTKTAKKTTPKRHISLIIPHDTQQNVIYLAPRTGEFLHGLFSFLEIDNTQDSIQFLHTQSTINKLIPLGTLKQTYSHFTLHANVYLWNAQFLSHPANSWYSLNDAQKLPMSRADNKALQLLLLSPHKAV